MSCRELVYNEETKGFYEGSGNNQLHVKRYMIIYGCLPIYNHSHQWVRPSYVATMFENKPFLNVCNLSLTNYHPCYKVTISFQRAATHEEDHQTGLNYNTHREGKMHFC